MKPESKQFLYLSLGFLAIWFFIGVLPRNNLNLGWRIFADESDRYVYFLRGQWLPLGQVPYRDVFSEYPQIPTFLFGLLHIPFLGETREALAYAQYSLIFAITMLGVLLSLVLILKRLLPEHKSIWLLPFLLPAPIYFTLNRFDVLPAFFTVLSIYLVHRKMMERAAIVLAMGAFTKWYPGLLLPPLLFYIWQVTPKRLWTSLAAFVMTSFVIVVPTFLFGGVDALLVPYLFHSGRSLETVSLPVMLGLVLGKISSLDAGQFLLPGFLLLQVSPLPFLVFKKIDTFEKLVKWDLIIVAVYVLFARIYSPQWILWVLPLMVLSSRDRFDILLILVYGTLTYLGFPVVWDILGSTSPEMFLMSAINTALLSIIILRAVLQLRNLERKP